MTRTDPTSAPDEGTQIRQHKILHFANIQRGAVQHRQYTRYALRCWRLFGLRIDPVMVDDFDKSSGDVPKMPAPCNVGHGSPLVYGELARLHCQPPGGIVTLNARPDGYTGCHVWHHLFAGSGVCDTCLDRSFLRQQILHDVSDALNTWQGPCAITDV